MDPNASPTSPRPVPSAAEPSLPQAGDAARFLLSRGPGGDAESRRVVIAFGVMLLAAAAVLNMGLYRSARTRFEREGWARLEASAEMRRSQMAYGLAVFRREAMQMVEDPVVASRTLELLRGARDANVRAELDGRLGDASRHFQFENVQVLDAAGRIVYQSAPTTPDEPVAIARLAERAIAERRDVIGDPHGDELLLATPVAGPDHRVHGTIIVHTIADGLFDSQLARWPGLGDANGAFLVRPDGGSAVVLTGFGSHLGLHVGQRLPLQSSDHLAEAMAASGVESRIEVHAVEGRPTWAVTRWLVAPGWGLVTVAGRDDLLLGLRDTTRGLVLFDVALAIGMLAVAIVWRRTYTNALTRQAMDITSRHARRVQAVFDNAFDAIFTFDRAGRIRTVNRAAEQLFGRTP